MTDTPNLDLNTLFSGRPGLTPSEGGHLAECALVCYDYCRHITLPDVQIVGHHNRLFALIGSQVTNRMRRTYADLQEATEYGACGIATMILEALEGLTICERASKNTGGFDYFLMPIIKNQNIDEDDFLGTAIAAMEVSGILVGSVVDIQYRISEKRRQLQGKPQLLPVYIVVVCFSISTVRIEIL